MNPFAMMGGMGGMGGMMGGMGGLGGLAGLNSGQLSSMWGGMAGRGAGLPGMPGGYNRQMMEVGITSAVHNIILSPHALRW